MKLALYTVAVSLVGTLAFGSHKSIGSFVARSSPPFVSMSPRPTTCLNAAAPKGPGNIQRPQNEFSRTFRTESVFGSKPRDYQVSIQATEEERKALAARFDLSNIEKLEAELCMRREPSAKGGANRVTAVEVEGTIVAGVTQTCVRTNEDFDVDLEFSLFALVRPVAPLFDDLQEDVNLTESKSFEEDVRSKKGKKKKDSKALDVPERNVNAIDILELQRLLQDLDTEDDVIEDESIYSLDGVIDLGELCSQLFWLKLDPYPKKPGTYPIRTSITG